MQNIKLLKELFPKALFIHIVRDVRDHCLSNMKAWNKNPFRSAQMWTDAIRKCRSDAFNYLKEDYYELNYESLIENPPSILKSVCDFIGVKYESNMAVLHKPSENLGDAKSTTSIMRNNKGKWQLEMETNMVREIEKISFSMMKERGYPNLVCQI